MNETKCAHGCGGNRFYKSTVVSCNEVPPIFKCVKCDKYQPKKINEVLYGFGVLSINTKEEHFMTHLKCYECGTEYLGTWDVDSLPQGWTIEDRVIKDPEGNPMYRTYAWCPKCQKK